MSCWQARPLKIAGIKRRLMLSIVRAGDELISSRNKGHGTRGSSLMTGFKGGGSGGKSEVKNGLKLSQRKNPEYVM